MIRSDASEVFALADDLLDTSRKSIPAAREAVREAGEVVEKAWQNAARRTHDSHAKFYSESISSELADAQEASDSAPMSAPAMARERTGTTGLRSSRSIISWRFVP